MTCLTRTVTQTRENSAKLNGRFDPKDNIPIPDLPPIDSLMRLAVSCLCAWETLVGMPDDNFPVRCVVVGLQMVDSVNDSYPADCARKFIGAMC